MLARKDLSRSTAADPAVPVIHRIQQVLASAGAPGTFATRHTAGINDIYFDVVLAVGYRGGISPHPGGSDRNPACMAWLRYGSTWLRQAPLLVRPAVAVPQNELCSIGGIAGGVVQAFAGGGID